MTKEEYLAIPTFMRKKGNMSEYYFYALRELIKDDIKIEDDYGKALLGVYLLSRPIINK